jgi:hypothetical protein
MAIHKPEGDKRDRTSIEKGSRAVRFLGCEFSSIFQFIFGELLLRFRGWMLFLTIVSACVALPGRTPTR